MKKTYLLFLLFFSVLRTDAQNYPFCIPGLFSEQAYYSDVSIVHDLDVVYGANLDYLGTLETLKLDIHYPNLLIDPLPNRPLIVLLHGGGFTGGSKSDMTAYCRKLARAGYVAASVDYRTGWNSIGAGGICNGNIPQFRYAVYRALQDVKASLRFIVSQATTYRIDTNFIFIAGQSEGGMTAMNCGYMNQAEADLLLPGASADLGSIDSASNTIFQAFSIKGIFNWCGAILDTSLIQNDTPIPLLSVHGLLDSIMPVAYGPYLNCQNVNNPYPVLYGPQTIYRRMKNLGICSEANFDINGEHCLFPSLDEHVYIPAKFTCFFKNLLCGNCTTESKLSYNQKSCMEAAPLSLTSSVEVKLPVEVFPNPAQDQFTISAMLNQASRVSISIVDITGAEIVDLFDQKLNSGIFSHTFPNCSQLPKGIYFLKMKFGNELIFRKLLLN